MWMTVPSGAAVCMGDEVKLDLDHLSAIETFTEGECWALAEAVARLTGWTRVGISDSPVDSEEWWHVMVRDPRGRLLDIRGPQTVEEVAERWHPYRNDFPSDVPWACITGQDLRGVEDFIAWCEPFARLLLERWYPELDLPAVVDRATVMA